MQKAVNIIVAIVAATALVLAFAGRNSAASPAPVASVSPVAPAADTKAAPDNDAALQKEIEHLQAVVQKQHGEITDMLSSNGTWNARLTQDEKKIANLMHCLELEDQNVYSIGTHQGFPDALAHDNICVNLVDSVGGLG